MRLCHLGWIVAVSLLGCAVPPDVAGGHGGASSGAASGGPSSGGSSNGAGTSSGGSASSGGGSSSGSSSGSGGSSGGRTTLAVNAGGAAAGSFLADAYFSGGSTFSTTSPIDTAQIAGDVPPAAVLQTERYGEFTYTLPDRAPGTAQTLTLYFEESFWTAAGQRTFDVQINGEAVLTAFDIYAAAGGANRAIARTFTATADAGGRVTVRFVKSGPDNPKVSGISVQGEGSGSGGGSSSSGASSSSSGASSSGGSSSGGPACPLPSRLRWTSTGPLASPKSPAGHDFVSLKDFSVVRWNGQYVVYATVFDRTTNGWNMVNLVFADWPDAAAAPQFFMGDSPTRGGVAPTLFYFSPKRLWVLAYQWGFTYATSTDPTRPSLWSSGKPLLVNGPPGAIDQTVICDDASCYLFFAGDNGNIYRSRMPIGDFPGTFDGYTTVMSDTTANLFEAVQVYTVKGTPTRYLMIVEAMGAGGRYFRSFTAPTLDGPWSPHAATESNPFAGRANVTFADGNAWTNDISHGDLVRDDPSETQTIDPCNLRFLYQGFDKTKGAEYGLLPYRPALLTHTP